MKQERRNFTLTELRIEQRDDGDVGIGHAAVFDSPSQDLGGFIEEVDRGAFDGVLEDDVRALFNHDANFILGRTKSGTLRLSVDDKGLRYEFDIPDTSAGRDLKVSMERGDIDQSSFGFRVKEDEWRELDDGTVKRTILELERLYDVSPVTFPAYPDTDVAKREYRAFVEQKDQETEEKDGVKDQPDYGLRKITIKRRKLEHKKATI